MGSGRVDPHRIRQAHQHEGPCALHQQTNRYALFALFTWCGSTSLLLRTRGGNANGVASNARKYLRQCNLYRTHLAHRSKGVQCVHEAERARLRLLCVTYSRRKWGWAGTEAGWASNNKTKTRVITKRQRQHLVVCHQVF